MSTLKYKDPATGDWVSIPIPRGLAGDQGDRGDVGATGDRGPTGDNGVAYQGPAGLNHYWQIRYGTTTITPVANTNTESPPITFTAPYRLNPPKVIISMRSAVPASTVVNVTASRPDHSGFKCYVRRTNATATSIDWFAVGER